ncbi:cytochrome c oxidase subunit II [Candidatus Marimicrobium litorale]|uniref:Cytochrome c oxidase subunit 2 n=1 Tax=Candidatus Marimicrobium litorale TaxID=2518991 RepID=A0ABT3T7L1_9GAMM|nr:cytochrome c oxidase subunit II [Candidatus Marimicrobium litorale]MCX2978258.1 cytochrome c oxidase subunit II [Candidatus Marimicrobium litorale]
MGFKAKRLLQLAVAPMLLLMSVIAFAADGGLSSINMSPGVTEVGRQIYDLHMIILGICVVIGVLVFGVMFYSIIYHRKSRGVTPATFHESTKVEIAWTIVPFIILIAMAVPATTTLLDIYDNDEAQLNVIVKGYQWKWKYEYINEEGDNVAFFSNLRTPQAEIYNTEAKGENYLLEVDEPLVLPANTKIRFLVTANDVIHSWWVPQLAVKRDAIPGFINEISTRTADEGVYRGQCAELCGKDHGFMPIVVNVVSKEEYAEWFANKQAEAREVNDLMAQTFVMDDLMTRGKSVYERNCLACHGANGEGGVGTAIAGSTVATGGVSGHLDIGINGVPGTAMQAFGGQLNDVDMAAVITYQRNAFGNNMGDLIQPIDVYNHKKGQ